ncbi:hemin-degrading factor [Mucilaginibacter lacusdianchii]|uniref:hemin-degrading factor n=1 Tax=Mucilaginibacter lacusdianchii TaxID=2684211 RepID=UPI00131B046B|nr:ChuX/HutX family heme-like substrate-binding protein [Mucilaginibacter sp. JXJ CY 39]
MEKVITSIKEQWDALKEQQPKLRIRDAAKQLGVSEAELVNTGVNSHVIKLAGDFKELLKEVVTLGYVMALTRNDFCVHERKGVYKKAGFNGHVGLVVTPDIDLRLFMTHWHFGFAVNENDRLSLQFFDSNGEAVHKIYLTDQSDIAAYHKLVQQYRAEQQEGELPVIASADKTVEIPDHEIDLKSFHQEWINLQDTHDFHGMLRKYQLTRTQALRLAPEGYAHQITVDNLKNVLQKASEQLAEIMVFTGSAGCIQIHTGHVKKLVETGPWFNVLDPEFNMHLRLDGISKLWLVKKPTVDGLVHSIEAYDAQGNTIVQFFGKRKPGIPESEAWRSILNDIL